MRRGEELLCYKNGSPDEILPILFSGKWVPKPFWANYVTKRCQVVFGNEHSLNLWKRRPCSSTVGRQLTDRRGGYTKWPAWDFVFINPIELRLIETINKHFNIGCVAFRPSIYIMRVFVWARVSVCAWFLLYVIPTKDSFLFHWFAFTSNETKLQSKNFLFKLIGDNEREKGRCIISQRKQQT